MRIVIFAGGSGRRLWPISRQKSPKQFEPIVDRQSTLQLAVDRLLGQYQVEDIYVSTNERYLPIIAKQLPELETEHLLGEPERRDLAPAVGLALVHLAQETAKRDEPIAIIWGDSYLEKRQNFLDLLQTAAGGLAEEKARLFFIGESPRFANANLGWLGLGSPLNVPGQTPCFRFASLIYRPEQRLCEKLFADGKHVWNTGYFVTTVNYLLGLYEKYQPQIWAHLQEIADAIGQPHYESTLHEVYPQIESISFDDAILSHVAAEDAAVLHDDLGWSDPGTLYALKEAIEPDPAKNLTKGQVVDEGSCDSLIYNYQAAKLVVAIGLEGMVVVNTEDALLVVHKDQIPMVKRIVDGFEGTELERFS